MRLAPIALLIGIGCTPIAPGDEGETGVETGTPEPEPNPAFVFSGSTSKPSGAKREGVSLQSGLLRVTPEEDGWWTAGNLLMTKDLNSTGRFELQLPDVPPDLDIGYLPGDRWGALYLPLIFDDVNENGTFVDNANDLVLGYSETRWPVYLVDGEVKGWSIVDVSTDDWVYFDSTETAKIHLFGLAAEAQIEGIYQGARRNVGIMAVDERTLLGEGEGYPHYRAMDVVPHFDTRQFDYTVTGIPDFPAYQFPDDKPPFVRAIVQLYDDVSGDGAYTPGEDELPGIGLCFRGEPLVLRYTESPRSIRVARQLNQLGWNTGWRFVLGDYGSSGELTRRELSWYTYGDECPI